MRLELGPEPGGQGCDGPRALPRACKLFVSGSALPYVAGLPGARSQSQSFLFWAVAAPICYLLCALWYHRRAYRDGLSPQWRPYIVLGLALFVFISAVSLVPVRTLHLLPSGAPAPGHIGLAAALTPLVAIALGLVVLAWVERSLFVGVVALVFGGLTTILNAYGLGNIPPWLARHEGVTKDYFRAPAHNVVMLGALLLAAATWTGLLAWRPWT